jgi:two-component system response regulator YesN
VTIKMLIVDDEPVICRGLRETIPWSEIGVEVAGDASDGAEALELIDAQPVDLVMTDINMDGMDGLELAKALRERHPHIRIIILSGYDDFEYARQALRIGVEDYLLKPVNVNELMGMVQRIGAELKKEACRRKEQLRGSWLNWLHRLMQSGGVVPEGDLPLDVPAEEQGYRIVASQLEDYALWCERSTEEQRLAARRDWEQSVQRCLSEEAQEVVSFFSHPNLLVSMCIGLREASREKLLAALASLPSPAAEGHRLHFGVSPFFRSLSETYARCREAINAVQLCAVQPERTVLFHGAEVHLRRNRPLAAEAELEKELVNILFSGTAEELDNVLETMLEQFRAKGCSLADIDQAFRELKLVIQRRLRTSAIELSDEIEAVLERQADLYAHNSYRALAALIRRELASLFSFIHASAGGKHHWAVDRVKKYIEAHYSTDLKASEVAAWLKITPNYFSIVFNQSFGKGFAEYLNEVRIEHAKQFLSGTHDRVFEIAEKVGYKDYKYFCSIFKSYTGVTPTQYRKLAVPTTA